MAIDIADADGLGAVSIRRIAAELDARPMSLYDHFANKDEILSSMADEAIAEVVVAEPLPAGWREAMAVVARRYYVTFVGHPWLISVVRRQPRFGPNSVKATQQAVRATERLEIEPEERWLMQGTLNDYVLGHSLRAVALADPADLEVAIAAEDLAGNPEFASLPGYLRTRASVERFEVGLETVLDGIERRFLGDRGPS